MKINKYTRDLYKQSLEEKWDLPIGHIDIFGLCPFCIDLGDYNIDITGDGCGNRCLIDKTICGSPDSIMNKLSTIIDDNNYRSWDEDGREEYLTEEGYADAIVIYLIEKIRSLMAKYSKMRLFSKLRAEL